MFHARDRFGVGAQSHPLRDLCKVTIGIREQVFAFHPHRCSSRQTIRETQDGSVHMVPQNQTVEGLAEQGFSLATASLPCRRARSVLEPKNSSIP